MKELSIEQKVQRYDEALKRAKKLYEQGTITESLSYVFPELKEREDYRKPNGGIVLEDFHGGDGFYKVNLAYLSKEQVEEIENIVNKWNAEPEESEDEKIRKWIKKELENKYVEDGIVNNVLADKAFAWLEKQGENLKQENYKTTICGKDYKCIKNYKVGYCSYSEGNLYHCGRDGYLTDDNGISWSCDVNWCKEYLNEL